MKEMLLIAPGESLTLHGVDVIADRPDAPDVEIYNNRGEERRKFEEPGATVYGFLTESGRINTPSGMHWLPAGSYFTSPSPMWVEGAGVLIAISNYRGLFQIGGPIEEKGRLRYIDGCSDTLLISPPRCGDPCLNHLHFPPAIRQTMHTHPSLRCGIVASGSGRAQLGCGEELPLTPGCVWILPCGGQHCFFTDEQSMAVIAFHPDSDYGPTDEAHPMLNKTMVNGVSAAKLPEIQTKEI